MSTFLEAQDGSCRFFKIEVKGATTIEKFGKTGTEGKRTRTKTHASAAKANEYAEGETEKQLAKGYLRATKRKRDSANDKQSRKAKETAIERMSEPQESVSFKSAPKKKKVAEKKVTGKKVAEKKVTGKKAAKKDTGKKAAAKKVTGKKATGGSKRSAKKAKIEPASPEPDAVNQPPVEWEVQLTKGGFGIYVNANHVYIGEEDGLVQQFDKSGKVQRQYRLPTGVKCIVGDGDFLYVGTHDGCLYDITTGTPRLLSKIEEFSEVYWMDIRHGQIAASDKKGKVALINTEGETIWAHKENKGEGWLCLMDDTAVYQGHGSGVAKFDLKDGSQKWFVPFDGVLFGQQTDTHVYAINNATIYKIKKSDGTISTTFPSGGPSLVVSKDETIVVAAEDFKVYNNKAKLQHEFVGFADWMDLPNSMVTWDANEFYGISDHVFSRFDLSPEALAKAEKGTFKRGSSFSSASLEEVMPETSVEITTDTTGGITCECVKEKGTGKLRVRAISPGYNKSWNVQFPRDIREEGSKYIVERIVKQDGFYRAWGSIKKLGN